MLFMCFFEFEIAMIIKCHHWFEKGKKINISFHIEVMILFVFVEVVSYENHLQEESVIMELNMLPYWKYTL